MHRDLVTDDHAYGLDLPEGKAQAMNSPALEALTCQHSVVSIPRFFASTALLAVALTGCSSDDSNDAKSAACDEWDKYQQTEAAYDEAFAIGAMAPQDEREAATGDLGDGARAVKAAFAKAAGVDSSWDETQVSVYEYIKTSALGGNHNPSEKTKITAACDRLG